MKVLHIGKFYPPVPGGIENFLGDLLPALNRLGVVPCALVHQTPGVKKTSVDDLSGIKIVRAGCMAMLLYAPVSPAFPCLLKKLVSEFKPDLLHIHVPNTSAFWSMFLPSLRGIPCVVHWHADVVPSAIDRRMALAYRIYRPFEQALLKRARKIICTSPPYLASSKPLSAWRHKCVSIPLGLAPERLKVPARLPLKEAERIWGMRDSRLRAVAIGRLTYYKGHEYLIKAAAGIPEARVVIVGNGEREDRLRKLIEKTGTTSQVTLAGFQKEPVLHALIATSDVLCLPSVERTEAFGLTLLEAMRYGKPVIATAIPGSGTGWVVQHEETGLLIRMGDITALREALKRISRNRDERIRMGTAGRRRLTRMFHIDRVAEEIIDLYKLILTGPSDRRG